MVLGGLLPGVGRTFSRALGKPNTRNQRLRTFKEKEAELEKKLRRASGRDKEIIKAELEALELAWQNKEWTPEALALRNNNKRGRILRKNNITGWPPEARAKIDAGVPRDQVMEEHTLAFNRAEATAAATAAAATAATAAVSPAMQKTRMTFPPMPVTEVTRGGKHSRRHRSRRARSTRKH